MSSKGFTIVELLIGMFLSSILMLTMLAFFKVTVQVGVESTQSSEFNSKLRLTTSTIQKLIRHAGFGADQTKTHLVIKNESNAIFWRTLKELDTADFVCQGVVENIDDTTLVHRFVLLTAISCNESTDLTNTAGWASQQLMSIRSNTNTRLIRYTAVPSANCLPFGLGGGYMLTMKSRRNIDTTEMWDTDECLPNVFSVTVTP